MENQRKGTRQRGVRLFTSNTGLSLTPRGCIRPDTCPVLEGNFHNAEFSYFRLEITPVNDSCNSNGSKVAKLLGT